MFDRHPYIIITLLTKFFPRTWSEQSWQVPHISVPSRKHGGQSGDRQENHQIPDEESPVSVCRSR